MPPKVKITKEDIVNTAIDLIQNGEELNARGIALKLNCSTQPIFSNFNTMDDLKLDVLKKCAEIYDEFTKSEIEKNEYPIYKILGMAYIQFAKEEKELFKILFMRKRENEDVGSNSFDNGAKLVQKLLNLSNEDAKIFQLEMWSFVHGIAVMHATGFLEIEKPLISRMLSDNFNGLKTQFTGKDKSYI